ncbi:hypothetical protein HPB52_002443 [Rhipicephalus sanguineus]|uniref:Transmembrane protein n=1 Tax=Rhipicephalus sanguineus TaxID=34632 RepID=A0A9D4SMT1_RHISA|nr:hypothetical protein HPB52_002443 [Rhipicephalus sanguineus]
MHSIGRMYHGSIYGRDRQYQALRCHWENVYVYEDRLWPHRQFVLRNDRTRRSHLLVLMAVIVFGPFMLGCLIYRMRGLDDDGYLFDLVQPSASTNAYNDRFGRAVEPHARWGRHGHRWQSPQRGLRLFSAHYRHELGSFSEPIIRVLALATAEFLDGCLVRARVVYRDYPNSIPSGKVRCRRLSRSSEIAEPSQRLHDAVLEVATGQADYRVPVGLSVQTSQDRSSVVWIPVKASFVEPHRDRDSIAVCVRVDSGSPENVTDLAEWYRSRGAPQVTAYGVADRSAVVRASSLREEFVPWYDPEMLAGVSEATATSLMLRDCALRSSATSKCVAFLGADERLDVESQGSRAKCCLRDLRLLRVCEDSGAVLVERRDGGSACEGFGAITGTSPGDERSPRHWRETPFRRCINGTAWEAVLFRVDDDLLDGLTSVDKSASVLPPSIAILHSFVSSRPNYWPSNSEIGQTFA